MIEYINKYYNSLVGGVKPGGIDHALLTHLSQLKEWSPTVKLVGSLDESDIIESLYLDSLVAAAFLGRTFAGCREIHDIGTGAGFPVLFFPWYFSSDTRFILHEARRRKASFLRAAAREMGALNIQVENDRVSPGSVCADAVLSRATFPPEEWLSLAETLLMRGGRMAIFIAGERGPVATLPELSGALIKTEVHEYTLPKSGRRRAIAVYEKRK